MFDVGCSSMAHLSAVGEFYNALQAKGATCDVLHEPLKRSGVRCFNANGCIEAKARMFPRAHASDNGAGDFLAPE